MAIKLDIQENERVEKLAKEEIKESRFKWIKIGMGVVIGLVVLVSIIQCIIYGSKTSKYNEKIAESNATLDQIKAGHPDLFVTTEEGSSEEESTTETEKIDVQMMSAKSAGDEVAELQCKLFKNGNKLLSDDKAKLEKYMNGDISLWYGATLSSTHDVVWKFLTEYDADPTKQDGYNCIWACYEPDEKYILCIVTARYNGSTNSFTGKTIFRTMYGEMYETNNGVIEIDNKYADDVKDMNSMTDAIEQNTSQLQSGEDSAPAEDAGADDLEIQEESDETTESE